MRPALALLVVAAISACTPLVCNNGRHTDPDLCGQPALCTTDSDCAERFPGTNGDPEPEDEWAGDTCAETDEGCPGDEPY